MGKLLVIHAYFAWNMLLYIGWQYWGWASEAEARQEASAMAALLKEHRQRAFLSTRELAEKAHVSPDTIWRIEGGNYKQLRPSTMRRIAEALGVHPLEVSEFAPRPAQAN
jgi:DNA-binding XRE family transcriptional regulator